MLDFLGNFVFTFLSLWILILFHELGHLIAALFFKVPILRLRVGEGTRLLQTKIWGAGIRFHILPLSGIVYIKPTMNWWRGIIIALSGPCVNLAFCLMPLLVLNHNKYVLIFSGLSLAIMILALINTDGQSVKHFWRQRKKTKRPL